VWSDSSCGTSSGSEIFAKEMRRGLLLAARAAKSVSFMEIALVIRLPTTNRPPDRQEAFEGRRKDRTYTKMAQLTSPGWPAQGRGREAHAMLRTIITRGPAQVKRPAGASYATRVTAPPHLGDAYAG